MFYEKVQQILADLDVEAKTLAALGCCAAASVVGLRWMNKRRILKKMEQERKRKDASVRQMEKAVAQFKKQNPGVDSKEILNMSLVELAEKLRDESLSPESVLFSYIEKALEVTKVTNCVTVFLSDCEAQLQEVKRQKKGPLYGVPISIKEQIGYQGHPNTCGLVQYLDELEKEDSVIVKVLKKQGAIIFAKTNVPQALLCLESSNPIYGKTFNPHNQAKGAGGSSGGEGALVGAGGSILGFGTDLGGSIRIPSSFCGIAGFKPTTKRLSIHGVRSALDGLLSVLICTGPMARDVDSLVLCMKALLCDEMFLLDLTVPPLPFNEEVYLTSKPLRIGYYDTDGYTLPNPGMRRAFLETKKLLEEAGHTLVPFTPPRLQYVYEELFLKALCGDGGETLREKFKGNIVDPNLKEMSLISNIPRVVKKILAFMLTPLFPRVASSLNALCGSSSVREHWLHHQAVQEYQNEFIAEWRKLNLDVILCPMLGPAFNAGYPGQLLATVSWTMLYNVLQFPVGVVPVGSVTEADEEALKHYKGHFNDHWDKLFKKAVSDGLGLPLSVQCVALPYQDELCLRFMKEVETLHIQHQSKR
ncbi:vitamin D3 hydroxylase-associated protein-like [Ascaphus truei]|uniref:vitamin D3 hydroxylase-associated protein-like n=1 Tax=Ascaphus truei TaxID=8439 RepID=UPI003F59B497